MPTCAASSNRESGTLLAVVDLHTHLRPAGRRGLVRAVDGVTLAVRTGQRFGLVGESGCGKSTLARTILRLVPATSGEVRFDHLDLLRLRPRALRAVRRELQIVFQDPSGSLNPRLTIETILGEPVRVHGLARSAREARDRCGALLERVGLSAGDLKRYPHEFSGGQRQRICIARALALDPRLIICDEPVSALDVSIQSQILNLLAELQAERGLTYLFISHNLAVVRCFCDEVAVMYLGRIVEQAPTAALFSRPAHPYTRALLAAVPQPDPRLRRRLPVLSGEPPSPLAPPPGCALHPRCPFAEARCQQERPGLRELSGAAGHFVACHLAETIGSAEGEEPVR